MKEHQISYRIDIKKGGKKAVMTLESENEITVDDFVAAIEHLESSLADSPADTH
jgi:hypothetical protein